MSITDDERTRLEAEHVAHGVAKWGEAERAGLEKQARAKSIETLRIETRVREMERSGATESEVREMVAEDTRRDPHPVPSEDLGGLVGYGALDE